MKCRAEYLASVASQRRFRPALIASASIASSCWLKLYTERILKMFKQKNAFIAVAIAVLLAACGGGGGGGSDTASNTTPTDTTGGTNNTIPPVQTVADKPLAGQLELAQVISNDDGTSPSRGAVPLEDFTGIGLYGQAQGASGSPLKNFGIKVLPPAEGSASGNGHIAIEVMDAAAGAPRQFQVAIDQVNYKLDAASTTRFEASVPKTAKAYVHVKSSAGTADVVVDNLPDGVVTVATGYTDDPSYRGLVVDLDKLFAAAKAKVTGDAAKTTTLNSVQGFDGQFNMNATFSAVNMVRLGQTTQYTGADITVPGQPVIKGAGVKGKIALGNFDPTKP
jgi:hypothetical protein